MINLNNSKKNSCFSAIFEPSDVYENYPDKKIYIKKEVQLQPQARTSMHELYKNDDRDCDYCLNER